MMTKTALITGASAGIGKAFAIVHAKQKGNLIIVARRLEVLEVLKAELEQLYGVSVDCLRADLSEPGAAKKLYKQVVESGIQVDYLINNAGFGLRGQFHELPWERQCQMINLNMLALTELMHLFLPEMIKRRSGRILNISSAVALVPGPLQAVYFASKAYVTSLSDAIAEELRDTNITVTTLMPGATESEFAKVSGMDKTHLFDNPASALSVAESGYRAMLAGQLEIISGLSFSQKVMMLILPVVPKRILLKYIRQMQEVASDKL